MLCSCCINTYKRPDLLTKLIYSLCNQNLELDVSFEVIVVDNDSDDQIKEILLNIADETSLNIKYFQQPVKNISITRNKAVYEAKGEFILFIDDDGYADKNWVSEFVRCIKNFQADGAFGQVIPYYQEGTPDWIKIGKFFTRPLQKTGEISRFTRTTNCIIKSDLIKSVKEPFDPKFGLTGGEDINLFGKLSERGAKFVFCNEAIVHDYVPLERANLNWLTKRTFRTGITHTDKVISFSKFTLGKKFYELLKGMLFVLISIIMFLLFLPNKIKKYHWYLKIISNIGHLAAVLGFRFEEYNN